MTHKPFLPGALLLASLFFAASVQATPFSGTMEVESIESPGPIAASGVLTGLLEVDSVEESAIPSGRFWLHAAQVTVEVDQADIVGPNRAIAYRVGETTVRDQYTDAEVVGTQARPDFEFYIVPHEGIARLQLDSSCGGLAPSEAGSVELIPWVRDDERPRTVIDTSDALHWTECDRQATAVVTGDFLVALWEHSAILTADNQSIELESGQGRSDTSPNEATDDTITHDRQVFLYVTQGRLELPLEPDVNRDLYLQDANVASANLLQFNSATGNLQFKGHELDLDQDDLLLDGELTLNAAGHVTRTSLAVVVGGTLANAHLNGEVLASVAPRAPVPWWSWGLFGVGLAVLLVTVERVRRYPLALWHVHKARRAAPQSARRHMDRAIQLTPRHGDYYMLRAGVLVRLGKWQAALVDHREADHLLHPVRDRAALIENARAAGTLAARHHRVQEAFRWLQRSEALLRPEPEASPA